METSSNLVGGSRHYELRFAALFNAGRGYVFPCDAEGNVDIEELGEKARANYLRASASVGREFFLPVKCMNCHHRRAHE